MDYLEPACEAFLNRKYGEMFEALGGKSPAVESHDDKRIWATSMDKLIDLRASGTVGDVIKHLRQEQRPRLPEKLERRERELEQFDGSGGDGMPVALSELEKLHSIQYREIVALAHYLKGHSPFETKHGVKGAEFENVIVVVGRGWNHYNFNDMLELAQNVNHVPASRREAFERNRNLFYVVCSRPNKRLAILFTQKLSIKAMHTLDLWFGRNVIDALAI